jgi:Protein tyrosine/serine phosphatase
MLKSVRYLALAVASMTIAQPAQSRSAHMAWPRTVSPSLRMAAPGVPQFGHLNEHIWRSGQPSHKGYKTLAAMGVKTVINLRKEFPQDKLRCPKGVRYVYIPMRDNTPPSDRQAIDLIRVVSNSDNWPVLIHCDSGESRTGLMCAAVRYSLDGWDDHKIMQELRNFQVRRWGIAKIPLRYKERHWMQQWELKNQPGAFAL